MSAPSSRPMLKVRLVALAFASKEDSARRPDFGGGRGTFHRDAGARRHLCFRRRGPEIRGAGRDEVYVSRASCGGAQGAILRGRKISPFDLSRRPRTKLLSIRRMAIAAGSGAALVADPGRRSLFRGRANYWSRLSRAPTRLSHLLSVRGTAGAPNAWHAAHPPARAGPTLSARLRGV